MDVSVVVEQARVLMSERLHGAMAALAKYVHQHDQKQAYGHPGHNLLMATIISMIFSTLYDNI